MSAARPRPGSASAQGPSRGSTGASHAVVVDGGNSKTDLALIRVDGAVLAAVRGPGSSPQRIGLEGSVAVLSDLLVRAAHDAGLDPDARPIAEVAEILIAGADLPEEERRLSDAIAARNWTGRVAVANDTYAVLRAGTDRGWGLGIVCGAGINCVGIGPDGREVRFPALGSITGDWGGGEDVGLAALGAAARAADGRGPATTLEAAVSDHFGVSSPFEVAAAIHLGRLDPQRLAELAPIVLSEAAHDPVARRIVDRLAGEIVALARAAIGRLALGGEPVEVLIGGGLVRSDRDDLRAAVAAGIAEIAPRAEIRVIDSHPIVGAALLALDGLGADDVARDRARRELGASVEVIEDGASGGRAEVAASESLKGGV